ncbi:hypothetical protein CLF_109531 [Clonorchis sinensis]|uniref:Uncharacterized protein n=1 Tax=Clonorchis sinensis TaxID=79923 RepID=H2KSJ8_CLOSI|nr:hypothetical protein CLF_109531 [Clonorchis sinensis]
MRTFAKKGCPDAHNGAAKLNLVAMPPIKVAAATTDAVDQKQVWDPYNTLKSVKIIRTAASDEGNVQRLLPGVELDDDRPPQLLRHTQVLACGKPLNVYILKRLWMQRPPLVALYILASQSDIPLSSFAETADKIHDCF